MKGMKHSTTPKGAPSSSLPSARAFLISLGRSAPSQEILQRELEALIVAKRAMMRNHHPSRLDLNRLIRKAKESIYV